MNYQISTLRDIYHLPSYEAMETCLKELAAIMLQARATDDMMMDLYRLKNPESKIERACEWPESIEWKDDGKGEIGSDFVNATTGETFLNLRNQPAAPERVNEGEGKDC